MGAMTASTEPAGLPPGPFTVADLGGMPDEGHRYELLDGVLVVSPAPRPVHQRGMFRLAMALDVAAPVDVEVLPAPLAVRPQGHLPLGEQLTELQPDIVVAREADYGERDLPTPPLLAVEVLSPSTRLFDVNLKRAAYERMGAPSYWLLDPATETLTAFELDADGRYQPAAKAQGAEEFAVARPFPFRTRPADLLRSRGT
jgi:Uma2 family endonuclease